MVGGSLRVLHDMAEIFLKVALSTIKQTKQTINSKQIHKTIYLLINGLKIIFLIDESNMS